MSGTVSDMDRDDIRKRAGVPEASVEDEISAIKACASALDGLDENAQRRALGWLRERYEYRACAVRLLGILLDENRVLERAILGIFDARTDKAKQRAMDEAKLVYEDRIKRTRR